MTQHLIDTDIAIGRCRTCWAYVMTCLVSGYRVTVDPRPLELAGLRGNLLAGRACYSVIARAGRPTRLQALHASSGLPSGRQIVAQHPCAASVELLERQEHAQVDPVRPLSASAAYVSPEVFRGSQNPFQGFSRVPDATHHPFSHSMEGRRTQSVVMCDQCQKPAIEPGTYIAIELGAHTWARHLEEHCQ